MPCTNPTDLTNPTELLDFSSQDASAVSNALSGYEELGTPQDLSEPVVEPWALAGWYEKNAFPLAGLPAEG